jgi:hypothetical protein
MWAVFLAICGTLPHFLRTPATSAFPTPTSETIYWAKWGGVPHHMRYTAPLFADSRHISLPHADLRDNILGKVGRCASPYVLHCPTFCGLPPHQPPPRRPPGQYTGQSGTVFLTICGTLPHFLRTPATSASPTPTSETIYWAKWGGKPQHGSFVGRCTYRRATSGTRRYIPRPLRKYYAPCSN